MAVADSDSIVEPFFDFVIRRTEADSLGSWRGTDLLAFAAASGRKSRLPLERLVSLTRTRPTPGSERRYENAVVRAEWTFVFDGAMDFPLPYSILGYHPGSLRAASSLRLVELAPRELTLALRESGQEIRRKLHDVRIYAFEHGFFVLDVDALVDRLLGNLLDDSWTVGFVTAQDGGQRLGLGIMLGRDSRPIYGEFEFSRDRIEPHGRPLAEALARSARGWLDPERAPLPRPWQTE